MNKFYIKVFGCTMRGIEAQKLHRWFLANGARPSELKNADVVCVFGCSIIYATDKTTLQFIKSINNNRQRIIILGCSPELSKNKISEFFTGEMLATHSLETIDKLFPDFNVKFNQILLPTESHKSLDYAKPYLDEFRLHQEHKFFIRNDLPQIIITGKGCPNACSYCSVRKALGPLKSYSHEEIIRNYTDALTKRNNVIIFNGDDTGAYGFDSGSSFAMLLLDLDSKTPKNKNIKWVIDNLHPQWLIKYETIILKLVGSGRIVELIVPLQAASNGMLDAMRRKHHMEQVVPVFEKLKDLSGELRLSTHFIIGFPGETDADIEALKKLIDRKFFGHINLLRYYESGDAYSHQLSPKIDAETTQKNMLMLRDFIQERGIYCQMTIYE